MLVRRDEMRASKVMQERVKATEKITLCYNSTLEEIKGDTFVGSVDVKDTQTSDIRNIPANGVFYAIGHEPNTDFLEGQLETDADGYLLVEAGSTKTTKKGIFACGDVVDKTYRQAISAAGTGCMAGLDAERYLSHIAVETSA